MPKISVYVTEEQKDMITKLSQHQNLSMSEYLLKKGLEATVRSDKYKSQMASVACQIYILSDTVENKDHKKTLKELGSEIYGILESEA